MRQGTLAMSFDALEGLWTVVDNRRTEAGVEHTENKRVDSVSVLWHMTQLSSSVCCRNVFKRTESYFLF